MKVIDKIIKIKNDYIMEFNLAQWPKDDLKSARLNGSIMACQKIIHELDEEQKEEPFLTERQARDLLDDAVPLNSYLEVSNKIKIWKEKGWIKKSKKQDFIDWYNDGMELYKDKDNISKEDYKVLFKKGMEVIAAIEEKENESNN